MANLQLCLQGKIEIQNAIKFGTSVALNLKIKEFVSTVSPSDLYKELAKSNSALPSKSSPGKLIFYVKRIASSFLSTSTDVEDWESSIKKFQSYAIFQNDHFFFHVAGVKENIVKKNFEIKNTEAWPDKLVVNKTYNAIILIFHPEKDANSKSTRKTIRGTIRISSNSKLAVSTPEDLAVDSSYDIRFYSFKIIQEAMLYDTSSWLTVTCDYKDIDEGWKFNIPFKLNKPYAKFVGINFLIGVLIGSPILVRMLNVNDTLLVKISVIVICVGIGFLTSVAAAIGIKKAL